MGIARAAPSSPQVPASRGLATGQLLTGLVLMGRVLTGLVLTGAFLPSPARGELLPVAAFGAEQGLGHDHVRCAVHDQYGLLWFCTAVGLARFDGVAMTDFDAEDGLPEAAVHDLVISGDRYFVATGRGLFAFNARAAPTAPDLRFAAVALRGGCVDQPIWALALAGNEELWMGCEDGLYRGSMVEGQLDLRRIAADQLNGQVRALAPSAEGGLWAGGSSGLVSIPPSPGYPVTSSQVVSQVVPGLADRGSVRALLVTRDGQTVYVGFERGLGIVDLRSEAGGLSIESRLGPVDGERLSVRTLYEDARGIVWVGAIGGLYELGPSGVDSVYSRAEGLSDETVNAMVLDRAGNFWLGTDIGGAVRWQKSGLTSFGLGDGLAHSAVNAITADRRGRLVVGADAHGAISSLHSAGEWEEAEKASFVGVLPAYPDEIARLLRHGRVHGRQARDGTWWLATDKGLFLFAATDRVEDLRRLRPRRFGVADGLPSSRVRATYEDRTGTIWALTETSPSGALARRDEKGHFETVGADHGLPSVGAPRALLDDGSGRLWVGWNDGTLWTGILSTRGGPGGGELRFGTGGVAAGAAIQDLLFDRQGHLWIATDGDGVYRLDDFDRIGAGESPRQRRYDRTSGLSSNVARCLTQDRWGRLYIGGVGGVDRLDPRNGRVRSFTSAHGLAQLDVTACHVDPRGHLWFGTWSGLSRLVPRPEPQTSAPAPEVRIARLLVNGREVPLSAVGHRRFGPIPLPAGRHRVEVGYFAVGVSPDAPVRYRYRLRGSEWTPAGRTLTLADLGPGEHRLELSAASSDDSSDGAAAAATLTVAVAMPLWRQTWFLGLAAAIALGAFWAFHRLRLSRALAIERVRIQIAADLHDDLGASLSRISLLSDAARGRPDAAEPELAEMLDQIGGTARGLTGRAREIVWSLDPRFDDLDSFAVRVRETAGQLLEPAGIEWALEAPSEGERIRLRPRQRQHLLLVLKEAMHNALRHSGARRVELVLALHGRILTSVVRDDGRGLDTDQGQAKDGGSEDRRTGEWIDGLGGHGISNMASRIESLNGIFEIGARADGGPGTEVRVRLPLK